MLGLVRYAMVNNKFIKKSRRLQSSSMVAVISSV